MRLTNSLLMCAVAVALLATVSGCPKGQQGGKNTKTTTAPQGGETAKFDTPDAQAATNFLNDLKAGKATEAAGQLSQGMREFFFPPSATWEDDQKAGYNVGEVRRWLESEKIKDYAITSRVTSPEGDTSALRGTITTEKGEQGRFYIRVYKGKDGYRVQRYVSLTTPEPKLASADGANTEVLWAREIGMEFLDALVNEKYTVARSELDKEFKRKIAPPLRGKEFTKTETTKEGTATKQITVKATEKTGDYNRAEFQLQMRQMTGRADTYTLLAQTQPMTGGPVTLQGKFGGANGRSFTLRIEKDRPDESKNAGKRWRVEDFEARD